MSLRPTSSRSTTFVIAVIATLLCGGTASADERPRRSSSDGGTAAARAGGWAEDFDGPSKRGYASVSTNDEHPRWHVEGSSSAVHRRNGRLVKSGGDRFHRMFSQERFGGPGTTVTISYRARATAIRNRSGSRIIEGAKVGLKWPVSQRTTGYSKEDPRSVYGNSRQRGSSPGSYQFLTGLTEGGHMELSRNGYGNDGYEFFDHRSVGYTPGTWKDVVIKVDWQRDRSIRVRYWHDSDASGKPVYEATDERSPFWSEPGFLWLRTDDADFEYDSLAVKECAVGC